MSDRERVFELFVEAAERPPPERDAWLAARCAGDEALRREVAELLAHDGPPLPPAAALAPTHPGDDDPPHAPPARIGRYVIEGPLGEGGMGVVYAARDPTLGRAVALKLVRAGGGSSGRARLLREAQAMAQIASPYVVPVYEAGAEGDDVYIAMELVRGATLARWLADEPRAPREVLARFVEAGRGLAAAHREGILHRDFKPGNVLVGDDGRARVMDFGLARAALAPAEPAGPRADLPLAPLDATLTAHGAVLGTPGFMSPEQLGGEASEASDQWSFAASLYRALYGAAPFEAAATLPGLRASVSRPPKAPPREGAEVDPAVTAAVLRALSPDPAARFPSMGELLAVLAEAAGADPDADPRRFRRQRRWALGVVGGLGLINFAAMLVRTRGRFGVGDSLRSIVLALAVFGAMAFRYRGAVLATRHNRRVVTLFAVAMATMAAHRGYALARGLDVVDVLRVDALFGASTLLLGAALVERWMAGAAAMMLGQFALSLAAPRLGVATFPAALFGVTALAVWNWRDLRAPRPDEATSSGRRHAPQRGREDDPSP